MQMTAGMVVADIGAGTGYFEPHLSRAVGVSGKVLALAQASVDRVLIVDTWHHIGQRGAYAARLRAALKPGGEVVIVDFTREAHRGPPPMHRIDPAEVVRELGGGGFDAVVVDAGLAEQYVVVASPR